MKIISESFVRGYESIQPLLDVVEVSAPVRAAIAELTGAEISVGDLVASFLQGTGEIFSDRFLLISPSDVAEAYENAIDLACIVPFQYIDALVYPVNHSRTQQCNPSGLFPCSVRPWYNGELVIR